ncbi:MAG: hypothetical protein H6672_13775 [Anaerolineaceae bacterium]|nr:hypothetical protein [Anaerolineaceae bacterium]
MKKYSLSILIFASMIFALTTGIVGAQGSARVWLTSDKTDVQTGDEVVVTIHVEGAQNVYGTSFKLAYDPALLEPVMTNNQAVTAGDFFGNKSSFALKNTATDGTVEYALTLTQPAAPVSGSGVIGTLTFHALADGAVAVTPLEASLVAPQFEEVDGRMVARSIQQITTQIDGVGAPVVAGNNTGSAPVASVSLNGNSASSTASVSVAGRTTQTTMPDRSMLVVLAVALLAGGFILLLVSANLFRKMRVQLELAG